MATYEAQEYISESDVPFEIGRKLGQGSFAVVYKATLKSSPGQTFAAKVFGLPIHEEKQEARKKLIQDELRMIRKARHIHTISLIDAYIHNEEFVIIMDPVAEQTLERYLDVASSRKITDVERQSKQKEILPWFRCLLNGLSHLHNEGIRHRDIKPRNILVQGQRVLFTDFGISMDDPGATRRTGTTTIGTNEYKAPEWKPLDQRGNGKLMRPGRPADIFSLGGVFLDMLIVFSGQSLNMVRDQGFNHKEYKEHADEFLLALRNFSAKTDVYCYSKILSLCQSMLQKRPEARPTAYDLSLCWSFLDSRTRSELQCQCPISHNFSAIACLDVIKRAFGRERWMLDLMFEGGAGEARDQDGRTILSWATQHNESPIVWLLLDSDKSIGLNIADNAGRTPLWWATNGKANNITVERLLKKGADTEARDSNSGQTPLSLAAREGKKSTVRALLDRGASIETRDNLGQTPLSWAAKEGHAYIVDLLLDRKADLYTEDENGQSPLSLAAEKNQHETMRLLTDRMAMTTI